MQILGPRAAGPVSAWSGRTSRPRPTAFPRSTRLAASSDDDFSMPPFASFGDLDIPIAHEFEMLKEQVANLTFAMSERQSSNGSAEAGPSSSAPAAVHAIYPFSHPYKRKLSKMDYDGLPPRVILIRHAESVGNVEKHTYCTQPDHTVPLTDHGRAHALQTGRQLRATLDAAHGGDNYRMFFMTSPYTRTLETTDLLLDAFTDQQVIGVRQAVQLREQDFGNFQDPLRINQDLNDRQKFGRFWFRFPNGESGADVYDRLTIFEDHLTRDMLMGRFADTSLVLVSHGLTIRIFLMRWFHWGVDEFLEVYNPDNCEPIILERLPWSEVQELQNKRYAHAKHCYVITPSSKVHLRGCSEDMCSYLPRKNEVRPKQKWMASRARMIAARTASRTHHLPNFSGSSSEQSMTYSEDELSAMQLASNIVAAHTQAVVATAAAAAGTANGASSNGTCNQNGSGSGGVAQPQDAAAAVQHDHAHSTHDRANEPGCISYVE